MENRGLNRFKKTDWILLGVIFAIALILRQVIQIRLFPDSIDYMTFARNIYSGIHNTGDIHIGALRRPPLYPHLIALLAFGKISSAHLVQVARQISVFAGALLIIPVYLLARGMLGTVAAISTALFVATIPEFLYYSGSVLTESLAVLFITLGMTIVWKATKPKSLFLSATSGFFFGLAFLTKHALIGFLPIALVWLTLASLDKQSFMEKKLLVQRGVQILVLIAAFFVTISPHILYLHSQVGGWHLAVDPFSTSKAILTQPGTDLRYTPSSEAVASLTPDAEKFIWEIEESSGLFTMVLQQPVAFMKAYMTTVIKGYLPDTYPLPYPSIILFLSFMGFVGLIVKKRYRVVLFCTWSFVGYYLFLALFLNMRDRYMFPVLPFLVILAGAGVWYISEFVFSHVKDEAKKIPFGWVSAAAIIALASTFLLSSSLNLIKEQNRRADYSFWNKLGKDISRRIVPGSIIMDRNPHIPYFSGAIRATVPYADIKSVVNFARKRGIEYWVVSSFYVPRLRPQFTPLLDPSKKHDGVTPVAVYNLRQNQRIIIYRILPSTLSPT